MNLILSPSLEQRSLTNIAIALWSQDDVRDLLSKSALHTLHDNWGEIKKVVVERSLNLQLPEKLQKKLLDLIIPVGLQILLWIDVHYTYYGLVKELPDMFVWTSLGTIDNISTAKILIMGSTLDPNASFALACLYCLEDEIKYCWNTFHISLCSDECCSVELVVYWSNYMKKLDTHGLDMDFSNLFQYESAFFASVMNGNKEGVRYLFQKANMEDDNSVMNCAQYVAMEWCCSKNYFSLNRYGGVMVFLLSQMNAEQQTKLFKNRTYAILKFLLIWPCQSLFLEIAKDKCEFLSKKNYHDLVFDMVSLMNFDHNLHKLFGEFWKLSPETLKNFVTCGGELAGLILNLFNKGSPENVKLILKDSSISVKKNIIFGKLGKKMFMDLISSEEWDSVKFLLEECISSRKDVIRIRKSFKRYSSSFKKKFQWETFLKILDVCIFQSKSERRVEDSNTSSNNLLM